MEQKRFILFIVSVMTVMLGWQLFVLPWLMPPVPKPVNPPAEVVQDGGEKPPVNPDEPATADTPPAVSPEATPPAAVVPAWKPADHRTDITLGSLDPKSDFRLHVQLDTRGASIASIELNDPRYRDSKPPHPPLRVVGQTVEAEQTLQSRIPAIDAALAKVEKGLSSDTVDWEVVPGTESQTSVTFRLRSPDEQIEVLKEYHLQKVSDGDERDAYDLIVKLTLKNLSATDTKLTYELQGPVGLPLENPDSTHKYRDIVAGFVDPSGKIKAKTVLPAAKIAKGEVEQWTEPVRYIGVDVQYFTVLLMPEPTATQGPLVNSAKAELIGLPLENNSDVSVRLTSSSIDIPAHGEVVHQYRVFAGPKRPELLPHGAEGIIDWGISGGLYVPQFMTGLLHTFYGLVPNYGVAIILLTVVVRLGMFPLSRKQALGAAKMQEIQPEIAALKKKYANKPEELGRAQMELFRKHKYNPFGGCLLMFIQLPIFFGLYQALNISVDLRMAEFLWIKNLAAPDALFTMPFDIPFLGNEFNLLPIITIVLFIVQQKMFMPPPADKEQELQFKMMQYMMIFMGFMFYHVPAGLCLYFIASSLWGLAERMILPKAKKLTTTDGDDTPPPPDRPRPDPRPVNPEPPAARNTWLTKLIDAAAPEKSISRDPNKKTKPRR